MIVSVSYHNRIPAIPGDEISELIDALKSIKTPLNKSSRVSFKQELFEKIQILGWSGNSKLFPSQSSISITSRKNNFGLCIQLGNIARYYADVIKLQHLVLNNDISDGIIIVFHSEATRKLFSGGGNLASYERIQSELDLLKKSITIPITLIGIG